jgi:hypothetical protein
MFRNKNNQLAIQTQIKKNKDKLYNNKDLVDNMNNKI